jgi:hypothetical protein
MSEEINVHVKGSAFGKELYFPSYEHLILSSVRKVVLPLHPCTSYNFCLKQESTKASHLY